MLIALLPVVIQCKVDTPEIIEPILLTSPSLIQVGPVPSGIGICTHLAIESPAVLQMMYDAGIRNIRLDMPWHSIERTQGIYDFTVFDIAYSRTSQLGIKLLLIFDYINPLYDGGHSPYTEAGRTAFTNYAKAAVTHFQGKGIIWEIYNEPTGFWTFSDGTKPDFQNLSSVLKCEALYTPMANSVASAIKTAYPNEIVVGPGMAWCDGMVQPGFNNTRIFLQNLYLSGACKNLDAISIHPYRQLAPEYATKDYPAFKFDINNTEFNNTGKYPLVICTEWGYSSSWTNGGANYAERENWKSKNIPRLILTNMMNNIPITILYDWMNDGTSQSNAEHNFGLVLPYDQSSSNPNITVLNGYNALKTLTTQLEGYTYSSRMDIGSSGVLGDYVLSFTKGTSTRYVCWNSMGKANVVNVPVGAGVSVTVTNFDGTSVGTFASGDNGYLCTLNDGPQYIVPNN